MRDGGPAEKNGPEDSWYRRAVAHLRHGFGEVESRSPALSVTMDAGRRFSRDGLKLPSIYFAYNTLLAIFPLLLLVSSILGFILAGHGELYSRIMNDILEHFPGSSGALSDIVKSVVDNRALVGAIGLIGLLWAGTRIPVGLEAGFNRIWKASKRPFLKQRLMALWVLLLMGLLGTLSVAANLLTSSLLSWTAGYNGVFAVVGVFLLGVLVSLATNFLIFFVIFQVIPQRTLPAGALCLGAAVGGFLFWVSEYIFNFYFVSVSKVQVLYGTIGAIIGLLIWLGVVGYIVFYAAEVVAVRAGPAREAP